MHITAGRLITSPSYMSDLSTLPFLALDKLYNRKTIETNLSIIKHI